MTEEEIEKIDDLDNRATEWVNSVVPDMYKALENAGITYSDEMLCHALSDGFKAGFIARSEELFPTATDQESGG